MEFNTEAILARAIECIGTAEFVPALLDFMRCAAPFRGCFLSVLDGARRPEHVYDNVRMEKRASVIDRWLDGAYLLDPVWAASKDLDDDTVFRLRDIAPDRFQQSTYFKEYYKAIRLRDEAAILIKLPDGRTLFYSIGRIGEEPRFAARDIFGLRKILPIVAALNRRHFADRTPSQENTPGLEIDAAFEHFGEDVLTEREREIAGLILKGHSSKSIARIVDISPGTVKIHRKNIHRKLDISSQNELFALFLAGLANSVAL